MSTTRRAFLTGSFTLLAVPRAAEAQRGNVRRLGLLSPARRATASDPASTRQVPIALRDLGYIEGDNLSIERRFAEGKLDWLAGLARELVKLQVDVILAVSAAAVQAAKDATTTIPIVMGFSTDPVGRGFAASLARPGGNITGVALAPENELVGKRLEMLKAALPGATRMAILSTDDPSSRTQVAKAQEGAQALDVKLVVIEARESASYRAAFATMVNERVGGLLVVAHPRLNLDRKQIHELAATHRIPAIYDWRENAEEGGLMAYGSNITALSYRVAEYIDKIFKGAHPADLPIEQPTKFELIINLKTAKTLGLTIPPSLLLRADQVIE